MSKPTPCPFCGYPFDQDLLGRYGCPNCEGAPAPKLLPLFLAALFIVGAVLIQQSLDGKLDHLRPVQDQVWHQASGQGFQFIQERLIQPNCNLSFSHVTSLAYDSSQRQPKSPKIFSLTSVLRCGTMLTAKGIV